MKHRAHAVRPESAQAVFKVLEPEIARAVQEANARIKGFQQSVRVGRLIVQVKVTNHGTVRIETAEGCYLDSLIKEAFGGSCRGWHYLEGRKRWHPQQDPMIHRFTIPGR